MSACNFRFALRHVLEKCNATCAKMEPSANGLGRNVIHATWSGLEQTRVISDFDQTFVCISQTYALQRLKIFVLSF